MLDAESTDQGDKADPVGTSGRKNITVDRCGICFLLQHRFDGDLKGIVGLNGEQLFPDCLLANVSGKGSIEDHAEISMQHLLPGVGQVAFHGGNLPGDIMDDTDPVGGHD